VLLLFATARLLLFFRRDRLSLSAALDLNFEGLWWQAQKITSLRSSPELVAIALLIGIGAAAWQVIPDRPPVRVERETFAEFPRQLGVWERGAPQRLAPDVEKILAADDYFSANLVRSPAEPPVDLFIAWYADQLRGGTHSPTDCLPGGGWEITKITQVTAGPESGGFTFNRAEIQKGLARMLVYYWYDQQGERTASAYYAKLRLTEARLFTGRSDGALVRLVTPIESTESIPASEERLQSAMNAVIGPLPRFIPPA
jgi:EpsI family protein